MDGGADTDTADYSLSTKAVDVSLAIGVAQAVNSVETDTLTNIENLTGSAFNDTLAEMRATTCSPADWAQIT